MHRRTFIQLAGSLPVLSIGSASASATAATAATVLPAPRWMLFDGRCAEGLAFAASASRRSIPTVAVADDITQFFYQELHGRWQAGAPVMTGLTAHAPYFCLAQLARDQGMRVLLQEEIATATGGVLYSWIALPRLRA